MRLCTAALGCALLFIASPVWAAGPTVAQCVDSFENAQRGQKGGHIVFSRKLYIECAVPGCPKAIRDDCAQGQADTERAIATVTIVARDAAGTDVPATIKVDGNPFVPESGRATPIDPGPHQISYTVTGKEPKMTSVTVYEGEKSRLIVLPADDPPPAAAPSPAPSHVAPTQPSAPPSQPSIIGPVILGGTGVLLLLAGVGIEIMAASEASSRNDQQKIASDVTRPGADRTAAATSADSHNEAANNDQRIALIAGGAGLLFIAGGAVWYFLGRPSTKSAHLSPVVSPVFAGAAFSATF